MKVLNLNLIDKNCKRVSECAEIPVFHSDTFTVTRHSLLYYHI
jgi:hypothetical protein